MKKEDQTLGGTGSGGGKNKQNSTDRREKGKTKNLGLSGTHRAGVRDWGGGKGLYLPRLKRGDSVKNRKKRKKGEKDLQTTLRKNLA